MLISHVRVNRIPSQCSSWKRAEGNRVPPLAWVLVVLADAKLRSSQAAAIVKWIKRYTQLVSSNGRDLAMLLPKKSKAG